METIKALLTRRSVARLKDPHPSKNQMDLVYQAALRAPDHAWLRPWRFIEITGNSRNKLAQIFVNVTKKENKIDKETENKICSLPLRAPMIVVIIAEIKDKINVPRIEQIQSTSAATQNMMIALHDMGFGAYLRTGKYTSENNQFISDEFSLTSTSEIMGYLYIGTPSKKPLEIPKLKNEDFVINWD